MLTSTIANYSVISCFWQRQFSRKTLGDIYIYIYIYCGHVLVHYKWRVLISVAFSSCCTFISFSVFFNLPLRPPHIYIYIYISWTEQQCHLTIAVRGSLFLTIQICSLLLLSAYFKLRNLYLLQLRSHLCIFSELASSQELIKSAWRESVSFIYGNFLPKRPPHIQYMHVVILLPSIGRKKADHDIDNTS